LRLSPTRRWQLVGVALSSSRKKKKEASRFARFLTQPKTVRGVGLSLFAGWAGDVGCCGAGLLGPGKFPSLSPFQILFLYFLFSIFWFEFKFEFCFVLQILKYLNINII
jgi:hypothetical protein